ncbi:MAG: hypothetical protein V1913_07150 [Fibrobacterota bacterium]
MKILALAGDLGGARALLPVIRRLKKNGNDVMLKAYGLAKTTWQSEGYPSNEILPVRLEGAECLMLGTSMNSEMHELEYIAEARRNCIRSVAVMDFWSNVKERFLAHDGRLEVPDTIAVLDNKQKSDMVKKGFREDSLVVTGSPALEEVASQPSTMSREAVRGALAAEYDVPGDIPWVLFVSQPIQGMGLDKKYGYDENSVLNTVISEMKAVLNSHDKHAALFILRHQREYPVRMPVQDASESGLIIRNLKKDGIPSKELFEGIDLVTGMNSMLLYEAVLRSKIVVSYQPGLKNNDLLPSNKQGLSIPACDASELKNAIERCLFDKTFVSITIQRLESTRYPEGAAERIAELLQKRNVK